VLELNKLYNMDCMEGMAQFPDKFFDLAIVDPPYGINATKVQMGNAPNRTEGGYPSTSTINKLKGRLNTGSGKLKNRMLNTSSFDWDNQIPSDEYFAQLFRISKNQVIWGGNYFPLPPTRCIICWDKMQPWDNFSQWEMAWTSFDKPAAMYKLSNTGGRNNEIKIHPTQKPVKLYKWIMEKFAINGCKIIDTHVGSGSSLIASEEMGFEYIGFEINSEYCNKAQNRIDDFKKQLKLF